MRIVRFEGFSQKEKLISRFQLTSLVQNFENLEQKFFQPIDENQYFRDLFLSVVLRCFIFWYVIRHCRSFNSRDFDEGTSGYSTGNDQKTGNYRVFSNFRPGITKILKFFSIIFFNYLLRVLCRLDYLNRFSNLEYTKKDQKNTLKSSEKKRAQI